MADEDEIDVLGDFSFNSCLAQNSQGIPSCSDHEDTVHPQWLLDATVNNWYDKEEFRLTDRPSITFVNKSPVLQFKKESMMTWNQAEKDLLIREMAKYGRDIKKISQSLTTKTEAEIQALIEAQYGIHLDTPLIGLVRSHDNIDDVPVAVQEEVVTDVDSPTSLNGVLTMVQTGSPTISVHKKNKWSKCSLLKSDVLLDLKKAGSNIEIDPSEILYDDELTVGSMESIETVVDFESESKPRNARKISNYRFKSLNKQRDKSGQKLRSKKTDWSVQRVRKNSNVSDDSAKPQKLQIVLGSGQALSVSEGEQVIKIEKKSSDVESDVEVDIDSDNDRTDSAQEPPSKSITENNKQAVETPVINTLTNNIKSTSPHRSVERLLKRKTKINLEGGGGCTIAHTEAGDVYEVTREPRKRPAPRKPGVALIPCRLYNADYSAPFTVAVCVSALVCMDAQAHCSRGEVMGLLGGELRPTGDSAAASGRELLVRAYRPAAAAASRTHCDMCPVSQALAAERLRSAGASLVGWHHSHPRFPPSPSALDLRTQLAMQRLLERPAAPFLGLITSQHWPVGRNASQYKCIRVEVSETDEEVGYQLSARLRPDLTESALPAFLQELREMLTDEAHINEFSVDPAKDVCPDAKITFLEKCLSSVEHHMRSAGYPEGAPVVGRLLRGIADIFR